MAPRESARDDASRAIRRFFITGVAVTVPFILTVIAVLLVWNFLEQFIEPLTAVLVYVLPIRGLPTIGREATTTVLIASVVFLVGFVTEERSNHRIGHAFQEFMAALPGIGTVFTTAHRLSEVVFQSDTETFEEVKLVEFPTDDVYMLAFVTAEPHHAIAETTGADLTLFLPLAPNPVMGGFLINVPEDRVYDVDISVEEGVSSIVTSGVVTETTAEGEPLTREDFTDHIERELRDGVAGAERLFETSDEER